LDDGASGRQLPLATGKQDGEGDCNLSSRSTAAASFAKFTFGGWMSLGFHPKSFQLTARRESLPAVKIDSETMILTG
jgi:hypothetical protein